MSFFIIIIKFICRLTIQLLVRKTIFGRIFTNSDTKILYNSKLAKKTKSSKDKKNDSKNEHYPILSKILKRKVVYCEFKPISEEKIEINEQDDERTFIEKLSDGASGTVSKLDNVIFEDDTDKKHTLIIKSSSTAPIVMYSFMAPSLITEVNFYKNCSHFIPDHVPKIFHCDYNGFTGDFLILMERIDNRKMNLELPKEINDKSNKLIDSEVTYEQVQKVAAEDSLKSIEALAKMHAKFWGKRFDKLLKKEFRKSADRDAKNTLNGISSTISIWMKIYK